MIKLLPDYSDEKVGPKGEVEAEKEIDDADISEEPSSCAQGGRSLPCGKCGESTDPSTDTSYKSIYSIDQRIHGWWKQKSLEAVNRRDGQEEPIALAIFSA